MNTTELVSRLTLVIPTKNEEKSIGEVIRSVQNFASKILVVDGHSLDKTVEIAIKNGAKVVTDNGLGKGDAIRCAINLVETKYVVFFDADGSHEPKDILKLVEKLELDKNDIVVASRLKGGSSELHGGFEEFFRISGSSFVTTCINKRFKTKISDSQNGFRAARVKKLASLDLQSNSTTIEQEMLIKALKKGYSIAEVPSHEYARKYGESHIAVFRVWYKYLWNLFYNLI